MVFGSISIGIFRFVRVFLAPIGWIISKCNMDPIDRPKNILTRCIDTTFEWILWAYKHLISPFNTDAYLICAMHGSALLASGRYAFHLFIRNASTAARLRGSTSILFFLIKVLASCVVGITAYQYLASNKSSLHLNYVATPVISIMIGTFFVATSYFSILSTAIDTMDMCFCTY